MNIVVLPKRGDIDEQRLCKLETKVFYISKIKSIKDLKAKVHENLKQLKSINLNNMRLWKIPSEQTLENYIKATFKDKINSLKKPEKTISKNKLEYLECKYTSINFFKLDDPNIEIRDLDLTNKDLILIEYSNEKNPFIFRINKQEYIEDICLSCGEHQSLKYICKCKEVKYLLIS